MIEIPTPSHEPGQRCDTRSRARRRRWRSAAGAWAALAGVALTVAAALAQQSGPRRPTDRPARTRVPAHVEVWLESGVGGRPVVPVLIDGRGPFPMGIDWGANALVLSEGAASDLGLAVVTDSSTTPGRPLRLATIDSMTVGRACFEGLVCTIGGFRDTTIAGVLGFNVFADALLTLDFPRKSLMVDPGELPEPDGRTVLALAEPDRDRLRGLYDPAIAPRVRAFFGRGPGDSGVVAQPSVALTLGDRTFSCVMDTRAPGWLTLPDSLLPRFNLVSGPAEATGRGPTMGTMRLRLTRVAETLRLGDAVVAQPLVQFRDRPGPLIGIDLMRAFAITLDQRNGRVRFTRAEQDTLEPLEQPWESAGGDSARER